MPSIGANTYPILFGDFKQAYMIVDRTGLTIMRDELTQAASGTIRFYGFKRTGGQVIKPEAIKKLKIATSL